jgi:chemotaxis protein CheX
MDHMQETVVQAIRTATCEVFTTMLGSDVVPGEAFPEKRATAPVDGVVSLIGLAGPWIGTGSLTCSPALACWLSGQLLMAEFSSVNDEVLDAVAELTNMIIGNVKTILEEELGQMALSIPTVVFGRNFTARSAGSEEWTVVPFDLTTGRLHIKICLAPATATSHSHHSRLTLHVP